MYRLPLGQSGLEVSAIGLGCVGMSEAYGAADEAQSFATLHAALDAGIDFLDTADLYGVGHNEELLGRFIQGVGRSKVFIATKFGSLPSGPNGLPGVDNSPAHIRNACEASLRRLRTDTIDLYYMHRRDPHVPLAESVGAMSRLVEAGKVRTIGLSEVSSKTLSDANTIHPIAAVQSEYSLWYRNPEDDVLKTCEATRTTFVPFSPLGRAFLTGKISISEFGTKDFRSQLPRFQGDAAEKNMALVERLKTFALERNMTPAQAALRWLLAKNTKTLTVIPIPGTKRPQYLKENAAATAVSLTPEDVSTLESIFSRDAVHGARYSAVEAARAGT
jgi:aryl-alcohol dehydrogenase-like predicted oxidoreductase